MKNYASNIFDFNTVKYKFCYISSIKYYREINEYEEYNSFLDILLFDSASSYSRQKLLLKFYGVKDVKFGNLNAVVQPEINIYDISQSQLEGIFYKVTEDEHCLFSFYCNSFKFELLN